MQKEMGIGIIGESQSEITPFQRQVFEAEQGRKARLKEEKMEDAKSGSSGGRKKNAMGDKGKPRSETVQYQSSGKRKDDDDVLEVF